jgi:hypothetical protein
MDPISVKINDTENLFYEIENLQYNINLEIKYSEGYSPDNKTQGNYGRIAFQSNYYKLLEYYYYSYIIYISEVFGKVFRESIYNYAYTNSIKIVILIIFFAISILLYSLYVIFIFTEKLIDYLTISRIILRIIPTNIIFSNNDIKSWIDQKV